MEEWVFATVTPQGVRRENLWKVVAAQAFPINEAAYAARVGDLWFLDAEVFEPLGDLRRRFSTQPIFLHHMDQSDLGLESQFKLYTLACVASLENNGSPGSPDSPQSIDVAVDSGAGQGALSLVALRRGVRHAVLIDNNRTQLTLAKRNLDLNGYQEGKDYRLVQGDLLNQRWVSELRDLRGRGLLISNIGSWEGTYGQVSNYDSMMLMLALERQSSLRFSGAILGGYSPRENAMERNRDLRGSSAIGFDRQAQRTGLSTVEAFRLSRARA